MLKKALSQLRMDDNSPSEAEARRIAAVNLRTGGMRLHLVLAALLTMTLLVGPMYLTENLFAVVPWVSLYERAYALYVLLDIAFYAIDATIVICLGLPLLYGCATIFRAAADGHKLPLTALLEAFGSGRTYRRAVAIMAMIVAPRVLIYLLLRMLCSPAAALHRGIALLLGLLSLALLAALTLLLGVDDALLPLALRYPDARVAALYRRSLTLTRHRLGRIWLCKLSHLGWGLLSILTLGVLFFGHALPYYCLSHTAWTDGVYRKP